MKVKNLFEQDIKKEKSQKQKDDEKKAKMFGKMLKSKRKKRAFKWAN